MATDHHPTWEELMGSNDWDNLLEPVLDNDLRNFILRCGNFCQATGDAFNNDPHSKYIGSSRYGKNCFFEKVMLESASDYQVKAFLYASANIAFTWVQPKPDDSWDKDSNMIGYIAVTTDDVSNALGRREIYIVWRGSVTDAEWKNNLHLWLESAKELVPSEENPENVPQVMSGWLNIYLSENSGSRFTNLSPRKQLRTKIEELMKNYKDEKLSIIVTGHSLGASLATLSAFDLVENGIRDIQVAAIVYASPLVGNKVFVDRVNKYQNLKVLRTRNKFDLVPELPDLFKILYEHVGKELDIDSSRSRFLKLDIGKAHNLQGQMHTVTGWIGTNEQFDQSKVQGRLALVNKDTDHLKDEYLIPVSWWAPMNNGMIRDKNGEWVLGQYDEPEPEFQISD